MRVHNARSITFYFTDFNTELFKDSLEYGIGGNADFNSRIGIFEGNLTELNALPEPITLDGGISWFLFATDKNRRYRGFELVYFAGEYKLYYANCLTISSSITSFL